MISFGKLIDNIFLLILGIYVFVVHLGYEKSLGTPGQVAVLCARLSKGIGICLRVFFYGFVTHLSECDHFEG